MTEPRQVEPGSTYLVSRRATQREFLLSPSEDTNRLIEYCLAEAANETGILLHAVCVMSNHWHGVVSDPFARLPEFLERYHRRFAKAQNQVLGRRENLWSSEKPSVILLPTEEDILEKMAYTLANPTCAGLVYSPEDWPGVITRAFNRPKTVEIPDVLAFDSGVLPDQVRLTYVRPPAYQRLDDRQFVRLLNDRVQKRVQAARSYFAKRNQPFMGVRKILSQRTDERPSTPPAKRHVGPPIAASDPLVRESAVQKLVSFLRRYREALVKWRNGDRDVLFPSGTYALRIYAGVGCDPPCMPL